MGIPEKSRWLIIPIEVLSRELPSRLLIACAAAARGYQVVIGNQSRIIQHISRLPRGIVLEKSICDHRQPRLESFVEMGFKICVSDEESDAIYFAPDSFMNARMNAHTVAATSKFCCWSELQRSLQSTRFETLSDRFVTTGTCRADIWRPEFRSLYKEAATEKRRQYGPYILFNSNFSHCVHHSGSDYMEKSIKELGLAKSQEDIDLYDKQLKEGQQNLDEFCEILPKIVEWLPDHQLVIRPHPVDDVGFWVEKTKGISRAHVIREGTATPWILGADAMLHHGCMTATEAALLGRPAIYFGPKPDFTHDNSIGASVSIETRTPDALRSALTDIVNGGWDASVAEEKLSKYFAALEGPFAFERLLDALDDVDLDLQPPSQGLLSRNIVSPTLAHKLKRAIRFKPAEVRTEADQIKFPGLTADELGGLAKKLIERAPQLSPVTVTPVHSEVFWIGT